MERFYVNEEEDMITISASKEKPISLQSFWEEHLKETSKCKAMAGIVDNNLRPLLYELEQDACVEFVDVTDKDGRRIYITSLTFLFVRAAREIFDKIVITVKHSLQKGTFFDVEYDKNLTVEDVKKIEKRMRELIEQDIPFERVVCSRQEAVELLKSDVISHSNSELLEYKEDEQTHIYRCGWLTDYYYGYMVPSTGYLDVFSLKLYNHGIVLLGPSTENPNKQMRFFPQPKLFQVYREASVWGELMGVRNTYELNSVIQDGRYREVIRVTEAAHERKICEIADMIYKDREKGRLILIAGPSSSGKTSFAHRLETQLRVSGLSPITISMDNYFVERKDTPLDENGEYDFETVDAIDIDLFNEQMEKIISGEEVVVPVFDFVDGKKIFDEKNKIRVEENQPIILEGIHGLNPKLTKNIPDGNKFRIYVSPLVQINLDDHNKISTSDLRIIRRLARDTRTRGKKPQEVIEAFDKLRVGEEKYIFPFQENADVMFNSALIYELAVLKEYVAPLLNEIREDEQCYRETKRLAKFLQFFRKIEEKKDIPPTSLLREFIGGSTLVEE